RRSGGSQGLGRQCGQPCPLAYPWPPPVELPDGVSPDQEPSQPLITAPAALRAGFGGRDAPPACATPSKGCQSPAAQTAGPGRTRRGPGAPPHPGLALRENPSTAA